MRIVICGSILHLPRMHEIAEALTGHDVIVPLESAPGLEKGTKEFYNLRRTAKEQDPIWRFKNAAMHDHFAKIAASDAILVVNEEKDGIPDYIGGNTLIEIGAAVYLGKRIYILNGVPDVAYREEILGALPIVLRGDLSAIGK